MTHRRPGAERTCFDELLEDNAETNWALTNTFRTSLLYQEL